MLFPAGLLVMMVVGAMSADLSHLQAGRSSLFHLASTMANDISTQALNRTTYHNAGEYEIDEKLAEAVKRRSIYTWGDKSIYDVDWDEPPKFVVEGGRSQLKITLHARVNYFFAKVLPGNDFADVRASVTVTLHDQ